MDCYWSASPSELASKPHTFGVPVPSASGVVASALTSMVQQHVGTCRRCAARGGSARAGCIRRERRHVPEVVHGHGDRAVGVMAGALGRHGLTQCPRATAAFRFAPIRTPHVVAADALRVVGKVTSDQPVVLAAGGLWNLPAIPTAALIQPSSRPFRFAMMIGGLGRTHHVDVGRRADRHRSGSSGRASPSAVDADLLRVGTRHPCIRIRTTKGASPA